MSSSSSSSSSAPAPAPAPPPAPASLDPPPPQRRLTWSHPIPLSWSTLKSWFPSPPTTTIQYLMYTTAGIVTLGAVYLTYSHFTHPRRRPRLVSSSSSTSLHSHTTQPQPHPIHSALQNEIKAWGTRGVYFRNPTEFAHKRSIMISHGREHIQMIADFDRTITTFKTPTGVLGASSHGILEKSAFLPQEYTIKAEALFDKYYPLEISHTIHDAEKFQYMVEWWSAAHDLLVEYHLEHEWLVRSVTDAVDSQSILLRDGVDRFVRTLSKHDIPLLIFSAGLADCIDEVMKQFNLMTNNMHVISNRMIFEPRTGHLTGFHSEIIHSLNKTYSLVANTPFDTASRGRSNVILLGDSLGDVKMAYGMPDNTNIIRVGFLNDKVEERLDAYKAAFDVVITGDGSFDLVNSLLDDILRH